ncbi:uncharacterized protein LOC135202965 isoform X1 [Macrobrachium nipponense]|uniref:uncharacterized protein LOC135202965 isoform X1 n=1 Tax=Macrobrachium nipponense TaxID=159736 RepID=UPI0030C8841D
MQLKIYFVPVWLIIHLYEVSSLQLILRPVGVERNNLVVFDAENSLTFCYPNLEEEVNAHHVHLPARDRDHGLDPLHEETQLRNNARVICKEISGFTHLEKVYPVPAPKDLPKKNKRVKWMAECMGYEPLLSHCFTFNVSSVDAKCENLLGIKCGYCSKKISLGIGKSIIISNPEYPHYLDDVICEWIVETPSPSEFEIDFENFNLPRRNEKDQCHRGSLSIGEMQKGEPGKPKMKIIETFCGSGLPEPINFIAKGVIIRFSSGLFFPRPIGEYAGFNLTVTSLGAAAIPRPVVKDPELLGHGEIMAILFGCILIVVVALFVCFLVRRYIKDHQAAMQQQVMQERLVSQRRGRQEVALTAMLAASLHTIGADSQEDHRHHPAPRGQPMDHRRRTSHDVSQKEVSFRTLSGMSQGQLSYLKCPPVRPCATPPPPPASPKKEQVTSARRTSGSNCLESSGEPLYMEPEAFDESKSYLQLDDISCKKSSSGKSEGIKQ